MRKLFALILAVSFVLALSVFAFAEGEAENENRSTVEAPETALEITCKTSNPYCTYNFGGNVSFELSLDILSVPESVGGISAVIVNAAYDDSVLALAKQGEMDEEGVESDFTSFLRFFPQGWEAFGRNIDGEFEICIWDATFESPVTDLANITFSVPFKVLEDASADTTEVEFTSATLYNTDLEECISLEPQSFVLERALQPDELLPLPDHALPLEIAGYNHAANNVIYYAERDITVGEYISSYVEITNGQDDMNYFAIAIIDSETDKVVYCDSVIGRPQSDKSQVVIPAGHYIIGVNGNKTNDFETFTERLTVGMTAELININVTVMDSSEPYQLENAGFVLYYPEPELKYGAPAVYDSEESVVYIYDNSLTAEEAKELFLNIEHIYSEEAVLLKDGDFVGTGAFIAHNKPDGESVRIIVVGDVNGDGAVDQYDYILVRRHYFETYTLLGDCFKAACIADGKNVGIYDYIYVKRIYFGTLSADALINEVK